MKYRLKPCSDGSVGIILMNDTDGRKRHYVYSPTRWERICGITFDSKIRTAAHCLLSYYDKNNDEYLIACKVARKIQMSDKRCV